MRARSRGARKKSETTSVGELRRHSPGNQDEGGSSREAAQEGTDAHLSQELLDEVDQTIEHGKRLRAKQEAASSSPITDEELARQLVQAVIGRWADAKAGRKALHRDVQMFVEETAGDISVEGGGLRFRLVHESAWGWMEGPDPFFPSRAQGPTDSDLVVEAPRTAGIPAGRWCILRGH